MAWMETSRAEPTTAAALFSEASGGATSHQLRHSALTHHAEKEPGDYCSPPWAVEAAPGRVLGARVYLVAAVLPTPRLARPVASVSRQADLKTQSGRVAASD
jgi:hypothetical protein